MPASQVIVRYFLFVMFLIKQKTKLDFHGIFYLIFVLTSNPNWSVLTNGGNRHWSAQTNQNCPASPSGWADWWMDPLYQHLVTHN